MEIKPQPKRNGFATFSLVLAIAALASTLTMTIVIPIFLAILSIMFGLLSRGNTSMSNHALAGVIVACSALLINIAVGGFSFLSFPTPMQNSSIGQWSMTPTSK